MLLLAIAIPASLSYWTHELELTAPPRMAAARETQLAYEKEHPQCLQVTKSEVKNPDGTVRATKSNERSVYCDGGTPPTQPVPTWLKALWILFLVVCLVCVLIACPEILFALFFFIWIR